MNKYSLNQRAGISQMKYSKGIWKNLLAEGREVKLAETGESLSGGWIKKRKKNLIDRQVEAAKVWAQQSKSSVSQISLLPTLLQIMPLPLLMGPFVLTQVMACNLAPITNLTLLGLAFWQVTTFFSFLLLSIPDIHSC